MRVVPIAAPALLVIVLMIGCGQEHSAGIQDRYDLRKPHSKPLSVPASGWEADATLGYQPPVVPLELTLSKDGVTVHAGSHIVTPLGTFSLGGEISYRKGKTLSVITGETKHVFGIGNGRFSISIPNDSGQRSTIDHDGDGNIIVTIPNPIYTYKISGYTAPAFPSEEPEISAKPISIEEPVSAPAEIPEDLSDLGEPRARPEHPAVDPGRAIVTTPIISARLARDSRGSYILAQIRPGARHGLQVGDIVTVERIPLGSEPIFSLGEAVVIQIGPDSASCRCENLGVTTREQIRWSATTTTP